ncbi:MAG: septal ring lytic transglycosylase RlpA family protein [Bdellovibrionota bacterium]
MFRWIHQFTRIALTGLLIATFTSCATLTGGYKERGVASYYGPGFEGRQTANGERFHSKEMTAAHRKLPFGTKLRVKNLSNGEEVVVRINDRGPYIDGRIIDLSQEAARRLGFITAGHTEVELTREE